MSQLLNLFPEIEDKHYYQDPDTKEFWFHATGICNILGFANVGRSLLTYTDEDERYQDVHQGRQTWFVSEAGCYGLAMAAKNDVAKKFKRWLKHEVLLKLRAEGAYIMPNATQQQLEALQVQLDRQLEINGAWEQHLCNVINESHKLGKLSKYRRNVDPVANAQIDLCGFAHFAIQHKDLMKAVAENWRLAKGTGKWQRVDHLKFVFESITNQYVPVSVLTAWLQEWDFDLRSTVSDVHNVVIWEVKLRKLPSASDEKEIRQLREDLSCDRFKDTWISPGMPPQYLLT